VSVTYAFGVPVGALVVAHAPRRSAEATMSARCFFEISMFPLLEISASLNRFIAGRFSR
jgi:hypothetical protein